jgi:hypothetical protein
MNTRSVLSESTTRSNLWAIVWKLTLALIVYAGLAVLLLTLFNLLGWLLPIAILFICAAGGADRSN